MDAILLALDINSVVIGEHAFDGGAGGGGIGIDEADGRTRPACREQDDREGHEEVNEGEGRAQA